MALDDLVARARELKASGGHDNTLANQLAAAATVHYGSDNRSPELIDIIGLSSSLREVKKPEWTQQFEVLDIGDVPPQQDSGYFTISRYGFGRVDLLKDGQRVNRIYGIVFRLDPRDERTELPSAYDHNFDIKAHVNTEARHSRGRELLRKIQSQMDFGPQNGAYGLLFETYRNDPSMANHAHPGVGGDILELTVDAVRQLVTDRIDNIAEYIARCYLRVRQVGTVIDGGRRYKK